MVFCPVSLGRTPGQSGVPYPYTYLYLCQFIYQLVVRRLALLRTEKRSDLEHKKITPSWRFQRLPLGKIFECCFEGGKE